MSSEHNTPDILMSGFKKPFLDFAGQLFVFTTENNSLKREIIVVGEAGSDIDGEITCDYVVCPQSIKLAGKIKCKSIITCGMNTRCTLSFSSISYDKALLSVNRRIDMGQKSIHQCERPVDYYEQLTVYENLVLQSLSILTIK